MPRNSKGKTPAAATTAPTPAITKRGQAKSPALRPNAAEVLQGAARSRKPAAAAATKKPPPKKATGKELPERLTRGAASLGAAADAAADATTDDDDDDDDDDSAQREAVGGKDDGEEAGEEAAVAAPVSDHETVLEDDGNEAPNPLLDQDAESLSLAAGFAGEAQGPEETQEDDADVQGPTTSGGGIGVEDLEDAGEGEDGGEEGPSPADGGCWAETLVALRVFTNFKRCVAALDAATEAWRAGPELREDQKSDAYLGIKGALYIQYTYTNIHT